MIRYYALGGGGVARRDPEAGLIEIFDRRVGRYVWYPPVLGRITGLGGDPAATEITETEAAAIIAAGVPVHRLDGPESEVSYRDVT